MKEELDGYIERIEKAIGRTLEEDALDEGEVYVHRLPRVDEETGRHRESQRRKDGVRSMRITLDPVQMLHRPLLWYSVSFDPSFLTIRSSMYLDCMPC